MRRRQVRPPILRLRACVSAVPAFELFSACADKRPRSSCAALPLVNSAGTSVTCTTAADRDARIAATGATTGAASGSSSSAAASSSSAAAGDNAANGNAAASSTAAAPAASSTAAAGDVQASTTLDPKAIQPNYASDGVVK